MAILTALAVVSAAVSIGSTVVQHRAAKDASRARRKANAIASARESVRNRFNRRRAAKETRLRQSQILQAAETQGVAGSSGEIGAIGSLQRSLAQATAFQTGETLAAEGISEQNQVGADARSRASRAAGVANLFGSISEFGQSDVGQSVFG